MDRQSWIEFEKWLEWLYERQLMRVRPEMRDRCGPILETRELLLQVKEQNMEALTLIMQRPSLLERDCAGCEGNCSPSQ